MYAAYKSADYETSETIYRRQKARYAREKHILSKKQKKKLSNLTCSCPSPRPRRNRRFKRRTAPSSEPTHSSKVCNTAVVNLSQVTLTDGQKCVLSRGQKFCPTPRSLDMQQLTEDIQEGCRKLRLRELHFDPAEGTSTPHRFYKATGYRPPEGRDRGLDVYCDLLQSRTENYTRKTRPTDNVKPTERKALNELRALVMARTIRISPADKGGAIVVQDTTD